MLLLWLAARVILPIKTSSKQSLPELASYVSQIVVWQVAEVCQVSAARLRESPA
jgi:hypothetical protein